MQEKRNYQIHEKYNQFYKIKDKTNKKRKIIFLDTPKWRAIYSMSDYLNRFNGLIEKIEKI